MDEFPDVVELNVQGQTRTTLLSLLIKDENSVLAAMFTGRQPVYKDEKGRYFIDANPYAFDYILKYLKNGDLPDFKGNSSGFGFGGGGGLFGRPHTYAEDEIRSLYKEASYFGIKELAEALEAYQPILIEKRLETYRKSRRSYEESLNLILSAITGEEILYGQNMIVQLRQETQTAEEPKCCSHNCIDDSSRSFGQAQHVWETDVVVTIPSQLDVPLFKMIYTDIQNLGYKIQGRLAICHFRCTKRTNKNRQGFTGFGYHPDLYCCMEKMFLIQFVLGDSSSDSFARYRQSNKGGGLFGAGPAQNQGGLFGAAPAQNQGGLFGTGPAQTPGLSFGAAPVQGTGFGAQTTQAQGLGNNNAAQSSPFGSSSQQQQNKNQSSGFSFGGAPAFGSTSNSSPGQNKQASGTVFGGSSSPAQTQGFGSFSGKGASNPGQKSVFGQPACFGQPASQTSSGFGQSAFDQSAAFQNQGSGGFGGLSVGSGFFASKTSSATTETTTTVAPGGFNFNTATTDTTASDQQTTGFTFGSSSQPEDK